MAIKNDILWRVGIIYIFMFLFAVGIVARIIFLQFAEKDRWTLVDESAPIRQVAISADRGDILSSDGKILALSVPYYEIRMDLTVESLSDDYFYNNVDGLSRKLAALFGDKSWDNYKRELVRARKAKLQYFLIKSDVSYDQMCKVREFPIFKLGRYKGGVRFIQDNKRIRPNGYLAARTIGSTTKSELGNRVGIEGAYDEELDGEEGLSLQKRLSGNLYVPIGDSPQIEPRDGKDVVSTIDLNIQDVAENALFKALNTHAAHHGSAVVMEVATGEVKAIANLERDGSGRYYESYNFAIGESISPGSTFKLASVIVALEDGYIDNNDIVDTGDGVIYYYGKKLEDSGDKGLGKITVQRAFEVSSNVGISKLINTNYKGREKKFVDGLYKLGLNKMLELDIQGEGIPEIRSPDKPGWSGITLPWMSIGYEVRMTPLQVLTLYNAIANDGVMVKPRFVKEIRFHGSLEKSFGPEIINSSICSRSTLRKVRKMLEGVVDSGTAKNLRNINYKIAGKTGTSQIADKKTGYADKSNLTYQASFVGYFPADDPRYSCIVVINSPSKFVYYGNIVAGPVFREIANKVYATSLNMHEPINKKRSHLTEIPYTKSGNREELSEALDHLDIPFSLDDRKTAWVMATQNKDQIIVKSRPVIDRLVPNVVGMGLKDALYLMEKSGLSVLVTGRGTVKSQSLSPGTVAHPGYKVKIEMTIPDS